MMLIDVGKCIVCGKAHEDIEAEDLGDGTATYVCEGRPVEVHVLSAAEPADSSVSVTLHDGPAMEPPYEPRAEDKSVALRMGETALEEHRLRLQALMKEAVAPLLERIDASERRADEAQTRLDALVAERRKEDLARHEAQLVEARKRFRASMVAELWNTADEMTLSDALADVDAVMKACDL